MVVENRGDKKAQAKLDKMYDTLEDAKVNMPDQVDKLTRAVEKNQMRVNQAKLAWQNAEKAAQKAAAVQSKPAESATGEKQVVPDIDALTEALQKAEANAPDSIAHRLTAKHRQLAHVLRLALGIEADARSILALHPPLKITKIVTCFTLMVVCEINGFFDLLIA